MTVKGILPNPSRFHETLTYLLPVVLTAAANPSRAQAGRVETGPDGVVRVISVLGSNPVHAASHEFSLEVPNPDPVTVGSFPYLYPRLLRVSNTGRVGLGYGVGESLRSTLNVGYGQPFTVAAKANGGTLARVTLVRLSSVTHSFNMNQRFLDLNVAYDGSQPGQLTITGPPDANVSPPGHYMLFLISGAGVPSVAQIVSVGNDACPAELSLTTVASYSDCEQTTLFTVSNPVNCQADYRWLVNGTYLPVYDGQPSLNWTTTSTSPTVQVQVEATRSCAGTPGPSGSSVNAYLGFTSYFPNCGGGCSGCGDPRPASAVQPTAGK